MRQIAFSILFLIVVVVTNAQSVEKGLDAITPELVKGQLDFLASDWTEGREVGTRGCYLAADYIASVFDVIGVKPYGDMKGRRGQEKRTFFQEFDLIKYRAGENQSLSLIDEKDGSLLEMKFNFGTDYSMYSGSVGMNVTAPIVFVGYGMKDEEQKVDDLPEKMVKGKIIVRLEGFPEADDTTSQFYKDYNDMSWWRLTMKKNEWARDAGALAIIELSNDTRILSPSNIPFRYEYRDFESDETDRITYYSYRRTMANEAESYKAPTISVSNRLKNAILNGSGIDPDNFVWEKKQKPIELSKQIHLETEVESELIRVRNVVGIIEGKKTDEFVVVGGHYDHLGKYNGYIYNGADDNASGTVGVMSIAKAMLATGEKPERSIIFGAWTGEECGLYGSTYFTQNFPENQKIVTYLNYDMIARDGKKDSLKNQSMFIYSGEWEGLYDMASKQIEDNDINLELRPNPLNRIGGGSDHQPFMKLGVPVFYYFAAMHDTYHQPGDELNKINWEKMQNIIKAGFLNVYHCANQDISDFEYKKKSDKDKNDVGL